MNKTKNTTLSEQFVPKYNRKIVERGKIDIPNRNALPPTLLAKHANLMYEWSTPPDEFGANLFVIREYVLIIIDVLSPLPPSQATE